MDTEVPLHPIPIKLKPGCSEGVNYLKARTPRANLTFVADSTRTANNSCCLPSKQDIQLARKGWEKAECISPVPCIKKNISGETSEAIYHASQCGTTEELNLIHPGACKLSSMRRNKANMFLIEPGIWVHRR